MFLALAGLAQASTAAIAVGASPWWRPGCAAPDPACEDPARALTLADDDAWRAAFLLGAFADPGRIRVLTQPDASTRDRAFPGGTPAAPSRTNLLAAVRELTAGPDPVTLVVYLAAHGSAEDVFLADGPAPFAALRADLYAALDARDQLVLISDACLSARWRSGPWSVAATPAFGFPPVDVGVANVVEVAADSLTPEDPEVNGGVLSYLVLSGLVGGADFDDDGVLRAQELSDFVHAYATGLTTPLSPVVRAPRGLPEWPLPSPAAAARVRLDRPEPRRWIVALPGGQVLLETLTTGAPRTLWLPPGDYRLLEIPVALSPGDGIWRLASDTGLRYDLDGLVAGQEATPGTPARTFPTARFRGEASSDADAIASPVPGPGPRALPRDWRRYHSAARGVVKAGGWASSGTLLDGRPIAGARVQVESGPLRDG